jgi:hypothetical protein
MVQMAEQEIRQHPAKFIWIIKHFISIFPNSFYLLDSMCGVHGSKLPSWSACPR